MLKTFLGWADKQLTDGTLILDSPSGHTYVTTPGSALLFPSLSRAVGGFAAPKAELPPEDYYGDRTAMMPTRTRTRAQHRAARIATERRRNRAARQARQEHCESSYFGRSESAGEEEPPPF